MVRTLPSEISSSIDWTFEKQIIVRAKLSKALICRLFGHLPG
jgi:hypothetical protein